MAKESSVPLSMPGHVSAPDEELSWCCKERKPARDVKQMATLTSSITCADRPCVMKLKKEKYMVLKKKKKKKKGKTNLA